MMKDCLKALVLIFVVCVVMTAGALLVFAMLPRL